METANGPSTAPGKNAALALSPACPGGLNFLGPIHKFCEEADESNEFKGSLRIVFNQFVRSGIAKSGYGTRE
jgi:hypothetical protein